MPINLQLEKSVSRIRLFLRITLLRSHSMNLHEINRVLLRSASLRLHLVNIQLSKTCSTRLFCDKLRSEFSSSSCSDFLKISDKLISTFYRILQLDKAKKRPGTSGCENNIFSNGFEQGLAFTQNDRSEGNFNVLPGLKAGFSSTCLRRRGFP